MSKKVYRTANGKVVNIDTIIAQNEDSIAIGNMRVNARGDELGPGGKIERTKEKIMADYYKLNTPVATDHVPAARQPKTRDLIDEWVEPVIEITNDQVTPQSAVTEKPLRGSLASSVAKTQLPKEPEPEPKKTGPTRI